MDLFHATGFMAFTYVNWQMLQSSNRRLHKPMSAPKLDGQVLSGTQQPPSNNNQVRQNPVHRPAPQTSGVRACPRVESPAKLPRNPNPPGLDSSLHSMFRENDMRTLGGKLGEPMPGGCLLCTLIGKVSISATSCCSTQE